MNYNIVVTDNFKKEVKHLHKKYRSLKEDIAFLIESLEKNPIQGIPLGKDCYKIRMNIVSKGKGKRGGSRIITCVKILAETVFLLSIYDKSEKDSMSDKELDNLLRLSNLM